MPITPYTASPYVRPEYVQDTRSLRELLLMASQAKQASILQRGQQQGQGRIALGALIANALGNIQEGRQNQALLAAKNAFEQHKIDQAERLDRDQMAAARADREAQQQWQRDQFRVTSADAAADVMNPGQAVTPQQFTQRFAGTPSEVRFQHEAARPEMIPAVPFAESAGIPGYATTQTDQQPFTELQAPSMSQDVAARPERYTRQPLFTERLAADQATRQAETARMAEANRVRDDARATTAAQATEAYRASQLALATRRVAAAEGKGSADFAGDFNKTGDEFLKTIPLQLRGLVKGIANYELDPTKTTAMRGNSREKMMAYAKQVNPDYDTNQFSVRGPMRKAFTSGKQSQQINSLNTAMRHLDQLETLSGDLQNGGFVPANKAFNAIKTMFGGSSVTNFDTLKDALAGEVDNVLSLSGSTVSGREQERAKINAANSPKQLADYANTIIPVLGSKAMELEGQYRRVMGENDPLQLLSPEAKTILTKRGFDPANIQIKASGKTPAGQIIVTDPNGTPHPFDTQAQADAFKKLAGIK